MWDRAMLAIIKQANATELNDRLRDEAGVTATLMQEVIGHVCRRFPSSRPTASAARIERLIAAAAWTEAALALIDLELPQWQLRRIAYDGGEWYCALSRERELPDWLDPSIEARHPDLALAILSAFVEAQRSVLPRKQTSVPLAPRGADAIGVPFCCDNFA
jgi:hypothetical protein